MTAPEETRAFAESVAAAVSKTLPEPPAWHPGQTGDDRCPELSAALERTGWLSLATDPDLLAFTGPAALELGRALAPVCEIDALLGGSPMAADLVRYHDGSRNVVRFGVEGLSLVRITRSQALPYGDAIGVHRVLEGVLEGRLSGHETRTAAWIAASVGYLAGVGERALGLTVDYAKDRRAFGSTLAALAPVQQLLADVATTVRGLRLLAMDCPGVEALAYSGPALCRATASCQQVVGAIGYTLEFPLQRAYRRARALTLWADAVLDQMAGRIA
ncbi:MAG: acyl-CoA dehydrogenase family protein [Actinomycetota bacterium]|nr:acyl-CoA dehydrogenase family protein [Actinomycetota bacterium]